MTGNVLNSRKRCTVLLDSWFIQILALAKRKHAIKHFEFKPKTRILDRNKTWENKLALPQFLFSPLILR